MHTSIHSARPYIIYTSLLLAVFANNLSAQTQCLESNDADMAKYMNLTKTTDAQACSPCAQLALYLCGATHCFKMEDKRKTSSMIDGVKKVIRSMGSPGCCPKLLERPIIWGDGTQSIQAGNIPDNGASNNANSITLVEGNSNPMLGNTNPYSTGDADVDNLMNASIDLANQLTGGTGTGDGYGTTQSYRTGDVDIDNTMDIVNASLDLANQLTGGTGTGASYGSTPSYSTGDADVDNIVGAATDLVDILGGGTGSGGSYYPTSADANVDALFGALGDAANEVNQQDRINQEAAAKRQREAAIRTEQYNRAQQAKQQLATARKSLLARYPDGQMPLSYPEISGTEVYFFVYRSSESSNTSSASANNSVASNNTPLGVADLQKGKYYLIQAYDILAKYYIKFNNKYSGDEIDGAFRVPTVGQPWYPNGRFTKVKVIKEVTEQEAKETMDNNYSIATLFSSAQTNSTAATASQTSTPVIGISNVFAVSKFSDGTWPLKSKVIERLGLKGSTNDITLSGYYTSRTDAESSQRYLLGKARECAFTVSTINCSAGESAKIVTPVTDFWGNPIDKTNNSSVNTTPVKETISNKPKLDFWGNPVKD